MIQFACCCSSQKQRQFVIRECGISHAYAECTEYSSVLIRESAGLGTCLVIKHKEPRLVSRLGNGFVPCAQYCCKCFLQNREHSLKFCGRAQNVYICQQLAGRITNAIHHTTLQSCTAVLWFQCLYKRAWSRLTSVYPAVTILSNPTNQSTSDSLRLPQFSVQFRKSRAVQQIWPEKKSS